MAFVLASPPGITTIPVPVGLLIWPLVVAVTPLVLCYLFFVLREVARDVKAKARR